MSAAANIIRLKTAETVYDLIHAFIETSGIDSENTKINYEIDIRYFFKTMLNKNIEDLTFDDMHFKNYEIEQYKAILTKQYAGSTVNRRLSTMKSLYNFLVANEINVNEKAFNVKNVKHTVDSYGVLSPEEGFEMVERVKKQRKGAIKSALIHTALLTSFRLSALLQAEWDCLNWCDKGYWTVTLMDKGQEVNTMPITEECYEQLQSIRTKSKRIFQLDKKTCQKMIKTLCEEMGIPEKRNITFHSLRKVAINFAFDIENDIRMAVRQGNHKNPATTVMHYMKRQEDLSNMPGMVMGKELDLSIFESLSKEELVQLICSSDKNIQRKLIKLAEKSFDTPHS